MDPFGVYVHVPFCSARCDYCAFATWTDRHHLIEDYLAAVALDIERAVEAGMPRATTVFVGGGTPSLVPPELLVDVLGRIPRGPDAEVTVECNPDDVSDGLVGWYTAAGVNRISIGVQSMVPSVLGSLGRAHDPDNVADAVAAVRRARLQSFNLDIIYGAAGEGLDDWRRTLEAVVDLQPPHVSAYALTIEAGTPLAADPARHPDDDDQADKYVLADEMLAAAGLRNYEVSNWAIPGHECRHNLLYWRQQDYVGFGCAAHSHRAGRRWWNLRTPERYVDAVRSGASTEASGETLDEETRRIEGLQLAVRMRDGIPLDSLGADDVELAREAHLIEHRDGRWVLTRAGRLMANEVAVRLR